MFKLASLPLAVALIVCATPSVYAEPTLPAQKSLLAQAAGLPAEFRDHFFDVPLAVRIVLDGQELGEAMVVLSQDDRVTLLDFTDTSGSQVDPAERQRWQVLLSKGMALGACAADCAEGLIATNYSLENSEFSILTDAAERAQTGSDHYQMPPEGSRGLMLRNQLNVAGGQNRDLSGRLALTANASLGHWTQTFSGQVNKHGGAQGELSHAVYELHTQREWAGNFLRLGYFTPQSIGLARQTRSFGSSPDTAVGVMVGSSDSLVKDGAKSAVFPIHVTANREAMVEIYRNGSLINSQQVPAGLQVLDTRPLPNGVYNVEVRLIEDGIATSSTSELVYKPNNWSDASNRWRYNAFLGRESRALSSWKDDDKAQVTSGIAVNYLLHPRAVVGASARQVKGQNQVGGSLDLTVGERSTVFANLYQTQRYGTGMDIQAIHSFDSGSVTFSHNQSWLDNRDTWETLLDGTRVRQRTAYNGAVSDTAIAVAHRLGRADSLNARLSHSEGYVNGAGLELGWMRNGRLFQNDVTWRVSVFDRPAAVSSGSQRNRGIEFGVDFSLGSEGRSVTASAGARTSRDGKTDRNLSVGYRQDIKTGPVKSVYGSVQADTYGVGLSGSAQFETPLARGDVYAQRSSYDGAIAGGLNVDSSLVIGGNKVAMTSQHPGNQAAMIVDVESDIDELELRADVLSGVGTVLRPGRNVVPVKAYRDTSIEFDFDGTDAPAAAIQPARARTHLNKGGVAYQKVRVMKTLTILGRLIDAQGQPMKAHHVVNHASRGVTEADGFFSMELSASTPTLDVLRGDEVVCRFSLDPTAMNVEGDLLIAGDLRCVPGNTTGAVASR